MRSRARWLYRLHGLIAVAGVVTAVAGMAVAVRATRLDLPSVHSLVAACSSWLVAYSHPSRLLVLALDGLSLAVIYRAARSGWGAHRSTRRVIRRISSAGELAGPPRVLLVDHPEPLAFCAGLLRPHVYVSTGALERLDEAEVRAVVAHEAHHAARRDPLRLFVAHIASDALFFLPVVRTLRSRYAALAELAADEAAVRASGSTQPLASAMLSFAEPDGALPVGASAERIDHLYGERPRWQFPASLLLAAAITLAALAAIVIATAQATQTAQLNASSLLMQSCEPVMLVAAGVLAVRALRFARSP